MALITVLAIWMLHWLIQKRTKGLVGEENRDKVVHAKMLLLFNILITFDSLVAYVFAIQLLRNSAKMNDIYIMIGFEFGRLLFKAIECCFKYHISLAELSYREQWMEKKFMFNVISLVFDTADFFLNLKLFFLIVSRGSLPVYILSEIVDNLYSLGQSGMALFKWRQFIYKLKKLKDVTSEEGQSPLQCCICLGDIEKGKQLSCSHVFHLSCLRSWLIEKVECPTCRKPIQLDRA